MTDHDKTVILSTPVREPPRRARLQCVDPSRLGAGSDARIELVYGEVVVGRGVKGAAINADGVSRAHAALVPIGADWSVEDRESTNGVLVNGAVIDGRRRLEPGDEITFGVARYRFEVVAPARSPAPPPPAPDTESPAMTETVYLRPTTRRAEPERSAGAAPGPTGPAPRAEPPAPASAPTPAPGRLRGLLGIAGLLALLLALVWFLR
ncbi:MAG: FHA domain-containing protein [Ectothiorhodospiraceae bacterium]|nr:FHA domain-containing protein [Chromatiales bacterium]MCP5157283.1 FHA domain-containing protein [Ectothiorhodospiraceae bacterium]